MPDRAAPPPPFRKPDASPAPTPTPVPLPLPVPVATPAPAPTPPVVEPLTTTTLVRWSPPAWARSRRVQIVVGAIGVVFLIGIIAAIADDDDGPARAAPEPTAVAAPPAPEPVPPPEAEPDPDPDPAPADDPPAKTDPPRRTAPPRDRHDQPSQRTATKAHQVRLSVRSDPAGATLRVDGDSVEQGSIMVPAGATVKITATKRGYKRSTRSMKITRSTSVVVKLEKM